MIEVTVKRFDELESYHGQFLYAGKGLGVTLLAVGGTPVRAYEPPSRAARKS